MLAPLAIKSCNHTQCSSSEKNSNKMLSFAVCTAVGLCRCSNKEDQACEMWALRAHRELFCLLRIFCRRQISALIRSATRGRMWSIFTSPGNTIASVQQSNVLSAERTFLNVSHYDYVRRSDEKITLSLRWPRDAPNIWVPWKLYVSAKSADDCARISTLQPYHYSAVKLFSKYSNQCDHGT